MRPSITTTEQLEWQSSLVCQFKEHLLPYELLASFALMGWVFLCAFIAFVAYDQHVRGKAIQSRRDRARDLTQHH